ncbi:MAG: hypothetical protein KAT37_00610 [Candidatus Aenigmarchaeota archaeon]|nr:hypothetical protein [Candidatus Aenigmarchaeota archaeon]
MADKTMAVLLAVLFLFLFSQTVLPDVMLEKTGQDTAMYGDLKIIFLGHIYDYSKNNHGANLKINGLEKTVLQGECILNDSNCPLKIPSGGLGKYEGMSYAIIEEAATGETVQLFETFDEELIVEMDKEFSFNSNLEQIILVQDYGNEVYSNLRLRLLEIDQSPSADLEIFVEENGIEKSRRIYNIKTGYEIKVYGVKITLTTFTGSGSMWSSPYFIVRNDYFEESVENRKCDGCLYKGCVPPGTRMTLSPNRPYFCSAERVLEPQRENREYCTRSYECRSNFCSDGICCEKQETKGILEMILDFFRSLFGFK